MLMFYCAISITQIRYKLSSSQNISLATITNKINGNTKRGQNLVLKPQSLHFVTYLTQKRKGDVMMVSVCVNIHAYRKGYLL